MHPSLLHTPSLPPPYGDVTEMRPDGKGWKLVSRRPVGPVVYSSSTWTGPAGLLVISELVRAELPDRSGSGPQWCLSISQSGHRPDGRQLHRALKVFGMLGAEEDNHEPGIARKFWRPLDPSKRLACECKADEEVIVEPDGYRWTNPVAGRADPAQCRGCAHAAWHPGRRCPIHSLAGR